MEEQKAEEEQLQLQEDEEWNEQEEEDMGNQATQEKENNSRPSPLKYSAFLSYAPLKLCVTTASLSHCPGLDPPPWPRPSASRHNARKAHGWAKQRSEDDDDSD